MKKLSNLLVEHNKFCNMVENAPDCFKEVYERSFGPVINKREYEISDWLDDFVIANRKEMDDLEYDK